MLHSQPRNFENPIPTRTWYVQNTTVELRPLCHPSASCNTHNWMMQGGAKGFPFMVYTFVYIYIYTHINVYMYMVFVLNTCMFQRCIYVFYMHQIMILILVNRYTYIYIISRS